MIGVDLNDPVSINMVFVVAVRTMEHCFARRLVLRVVIKRNHLNLYSRGGYKSAVHHFSTEPSYLICLYIY